MDKENRKFHQQIREWREQPINLFLMHPYPQLTMIITIIIKKIKVQTESSIWVVQPQAGKGVCSN